MEASGESKWLLGRMEGPLEEERGGGVVRGGRVCLGWVHRLWWMQLPGGWRVRRDLWKLSLFGRICLEADQECSEKACPCISFLQVPLVHNNQPSTVAYFGVACPELCSHLLGWHVLVPFPPHILSAFATLLPACGRSQFSVGIDGKKLCFH